MILSERQLALRATARDFAQREIASHALAWEKQGSGVPETTLEGIAKLGFFGMLVPKEYGGAGLDFVSYALVTEEFAAADCGICNLINVSNSPVTTAIKDYGTRQQIEKFLIPLATGKKRGCFLLTEANAGSDAAAISSRVETTDSRRILRGSKQFVTAGKSAHIAMVIARHGLKSKGSELSAYLIPTDTPGFHVERLEDKLGHRNCDTAEILFNDIEITSENLLGTDGEGYKIALSYLNGGRIGVAAQSVGVARAALEAALDYADHRETFGKKLNEHQAISFKLSEMATRVSAARALTLHAASLEDAGEKAIAEASMAKAFSSDVAEWVSSEALQIHGGYGFLKNTSVEKYYRDARVLRIYEGTNEIQNMVIARQLKSGWKPH